MYTRTALISLAGPDRRISDSSADGSRVVNKPYGAGVGVDTRRGDYSSCSSLGSTEWQALACDPRVRSRK